MKKLHVLNGDSSFQQLEKTEIAGDFFIWREILCEGPTIVDLKTEAFWAIRRQFLVDFFQSFEPAKHDELKQTFLQLDLKNYQEIILWFEYDLFCQINLIALLSWLFKTVKKEDTVISLICVGKHPKYQKLVGLGELQINEFAALYPKRHPLKKEDLVFANCIWELYCSDKHDEILPTIIKSNTTTFHYLESALYQHQKRFPNKKNGLNEIESQLLQSIQAAPKSRQQIVGEMLRNQKIYGFGDLQYFIFLETLHPFFEEKDHYLHLNPLGEKRLTGNANDPLARNKNNCFGGCPQHLFLWHEREKKLLITQQNSNPN